MANPAWSPDVSDADRPRRRPRRRRRGGPRWLDFSIAATALVVSAASLLVARHQAQVMDRQLSASVWPLVQPSYRDVAPSGAWEVAHSLDNRGVGPARIESFRVSFRKRPVRSRQELGAACCAPDTTFGTARPRLAVIGAYAVGRVLVPGEHMDWITVRFDSTGPAAVQAATRRAYGTVSRASEDIATRVCYCSVLNECWVSAGPDPTPPNVASCEEERKKPQYH